MTKVLSGRELAGFIKERQDHEVKMLRSNKIRAKLVIVRDSNNPVITKYVDLKRQYGEDIGIEVVDEFVDESDPTERLKKLHEVVRAAATDDSVSGIIVQLPLIDQDTTDEIVADIPAIKDVDGLSNTYSDLVEHEDGLITIDNPDTREHHFDSATATAILWLLAGHNIDFENKRIAVVGRGKLVGKPLMSMWTKSGNTVHVFHRGSDFSKLKDFDVIVTATGAPHLITNEMIRPGAVVVDAGTASEQGKLVGDISDEIRARNDLGAITPKVGGVGPLTINVLFENVIIAASKQHKK